MDLFTSLPSLKQIIVTHELNAKKSLGQHFLMDENLLQRIVRAAALPEGTSVIEIGPGPGGLTRALLKAQHPVIAIERDDRCIAALQSLKTAAAGQLTLISEDALTIDVRSLAPGPVAIVANLPYNISTPLLIRWLPDMPHFVSMTLMFQKEVADRLRAPMGTKAYGRLSVMTQWCARVKNLFDISPKAFTPAPKVTSTVIQLTPHLKDSTAEERPSWGAMEAVTKAAFGNRRKMLRSSLKTLGITGLEALEASGLSPTARAEELSVKEFCILANHWKKLNFSQKD